ncbi:hypothetical protein [Mesorhizobium amorphae]|uniref:hypothetical protein n=1 Tax=Mesorhizobium amorphae TaxID=71433 RepID=UPI001786CE0C|nr:hypothetical protein [Mesorhizobium amorphae]
MQLDDSGGASVNLIAAPQTGRDRWAARHRQQAVVLAAARHDRPTRFVKPSYRAMVQAGLNPASIVRCPAILLQCLENGDINPVERHFS